MSVFDTKVQETAVRELGNRIGFGRLMQLAEQEWRKIVAKKGHAGSEHSVGPCAGFLVPCICVEGIDGTCDWCRGARRVTKKVREVQDISFVEGKAVKLVVTDYHSGDYRPYRDVLHNPETDETVDWWSTKRQLFSAAGAVDGDEVEVIVRKTGRRPFGDRKMRRTEPHKYEREPE